MLETPHKFPFFINLEEGSRTKEPAMEIEETGDQMKKNEEKEEKQMELPQSKEGQLIQIKEATTERNQEENEEKLRNEGEIGALFQKEVDIRNDLPLEIHVTNIYDESTSKAQQEKKSSGEEKHTTNEGQNVSCTEEQIQNDNTPTKIKPVLVEILKTNLDCEEKKANETEEDKAKFDEPSKILEKPVTNAPENITVAVTPVILLEVQVEDPSNISLIQEGEGVSIFDEKAMQSNIPIPSEKLQEEVPKMIEIQSKSADLHSHQEQETLKQKMVLNEQKENIDMTFQNPTSNPYLEENIEKPLEKQVAITIKDLCSQSHQVISHNEAPIFLELQIEKQQTPEKFMEKSPKNTHQKVPLKSPMKSPMESTKKNIFEEPGSKEKKSDVILVDSMDVEEEKSERMGVFCENGDLKSNFALNPDRPKLYRDVMGIFSEAKMDI